MTHVSRKLLDENAHEILNSLLFSALSNLNPSDTNNLIGTVISDIEAEMIKKRLGIIFLLELAVNYEDIADFTKTTPQTVSRIKFLWESTPNKRKKVIMKRMKILKNKPKVIEVLHSILNVNISKANFRRKLAGIPER